MIEVSLTHSTIMVENDQKHMNIDKLRIKKVNKTHHMLIGEFDLHHDIDDNYQFFVLFYKKAGNDYKLLPYKSGSNFCEQAKNEKIFYPELRAVSDLPGVETCPWPAGTYHIYGYHPDLSKFPPILKDADYMLEMQLRKGEEVLQGIKLFATIFVKIYG